MQTETHICIIIIGAMEGACLYNSNHKANAGFVVQLSLFFRIIYLKFPSDWSVFWMLLGFYCVSQSVGVFSYLQLI